MPLSDTSTSAWGQSVIANWAAWAPGLSTRADWLDWQTNQRQINTALPSPTPPDVPKTLLRRLSPLAKTVLWVIADCWNGQAVSCPAVFSSANGEINRALGLLQDLQTGQELSPTAFSLSVHNAIAGLFSILHHNNQELSVLAPAAAGLGPGFIEALGMLAAGEPEVLLVFYDEVLPAWFPAAPWQLSNQFPCALALRLRPVSSKGIGLNFAVGQEQLETGEQALQLLNLIRFLLDEQAHCLQLGSQNQSWQWQK